MFTAKETEVSCWPIAAVLTRRAGRNRLKRSRLHDFEYWRSISAATVNGEAQAAPHQ